MKKNFISLLITSIVFHNCLAHFAPRGLTGGTVVKGIRVPGHMFLGTLDGGVFRSPNNAIAAWGTRSVGLLSGKINDFAYSGRHVIAATDKGLYMFNGVDGSDRFWNKIDKGLAVYFPDQTTIKINAVAVAFAMLDTVIFVGTDKGIFYTFDYGSNFYEVDHPLVKNKPITGFLLISSPHNSLFVSVREHGLVNNPNITQDYNNFSEFNDPNTLGSDIRLLGHSGGKIYVAKNDKLMVSSTSLPSFSDESSGLMSGININSMGFTSNRQFLATSTGLYYKENSENLWNLSSNSELNSQDVNVVIPTNDTLVVGVSNKGVMKSNDNGNTWSYLNTGLGNIKTFSVDAWGVNDADYNLVVSATERGVVLSRTLGTDPSLRNEGITDHLNITDVKIFETYVYASTKNAGVFRRTHDTSSVVIWEPFNDGLPTGKAILKLFKVKSSLYALDQDNRVWVKNGNNNSPWTEFILPPSFGRLMGILVYDDYLIIASESKIFFSTQFTLMWQSYMNGLESMNSKITSLTEYQGILYIGTAGSGVWYADFKNNSNWMQANRIQYPFLSVVSLLEPFVDSIQHVAVAKGYIFALFKGGSAATNTQGSTWIKGTHNHHIPSYANFNAFVSTSSRIFVSTPNNNIMSNSLNEISALDTSITLSKKSIDFDENKTTGYVSISTNERWTASTNDSWITIDETIGLWNGTLKITVSEFSGSRSGYVVFTVGNKKDTLFVHQNRVNSVFNTSDSKPNFIIYPNPSKGEFTIQPSGANQFINEIKILNFDGKVVIEKKGLDLEQYILPEKLKPGMYIVQITSGKYQYMKKITVFE
jgi:hypothetical protein